MTYDALIVDFGGVLTTPLPDALAAFADAVGIEQQDLVRAALGAYTGEEDHLVTRFETGQVSEAEFATAFAQRLTEISGKQVDAERLLERLFAELELEHAMFDALRAAKAAGLKTALLSNSWGLGLYPRELLEEVCDVIVISGEVGMRKPDPAIFRHTLDELGVEATRSVFVDDHPGHLKAAAGIGMTTVLHRNPGQSLGEIGRLLGLELVPSGS